MPESPRPRRLRESLRRQSLGLRELGRTPGSGNSPGVGIEKPRCPERAGLRSRAEWSQPGPRAAPRAREGTQARPRKAVRVGTWAWKRSLTQMRGSNVFSGIPVSSWPAGGRLTWNAKRDRWHFMFIVFSGRMPLLSHFLLMCLCVCIYIYTHVFVQYCVFA